MDNDIENKKIPTKTELHLYGISIGFIISIIIFAMINLIIMMIEISMEFPNQNELYVLPILSMLLFCLSGIILFILYRKAIIKINNRTFILSLIICLLIMLSPFYLL